MDRDDLIIFIVFILLAFLIYTLGEITGVRQHQVETVQMGYAYWEANEKGHTEFKWINK